MLVALRLGGFLDERPVVLHVTQHAPGGVFDRFAEHYQTMWDAAIEPIRTERDIDGYLFDDDGDEVWPGDDGDQPDEPDRERAGVEPPRTSQSEETSQPARRWPRRPSTAD
jgi:hypothetical protein